METIDWLIGIIKFYSVQKKYGYLTYYNEGSECGKEYYIDDEVISLEFKLDDKLYQKYSFIENDIVLFKKTKSKYKDKNKYKYKDKVIEVIPSLGDFFRDNFDRFSHYERNKVNSDKYRLLRKSFESEVKDIAYQNRHKIDNLIDELMFCEDLDIKNFINEFSISIKKKHIKRKHESEYTLSIYYSIKHPLIADFIDWDNDFNLSILNRMGYQSEILEISFKFDSLGSSYLAFKTQEKLDEIKLIIMSNYKVVRRTSIQGSHVYHLLFQEKIWEFLSKNGFNWVLLNHSQIYKEFEKDVRENWNKNPINYYLEKKSEGCKPVK